jgi:3D (Asp-Asp-Asp) domain-containing protein
MYFYNLNKLKITPAILISIMIIIATSCKETKTLEVTATAYNSVERQTKKGDAFTAAWGDKLKPGMKAIAVSRDLIPAGLDHKTEVTIEGLKGKYVVLDKMNKRWKQKIDIYMGLDEQKARNWGKRKVNISWTEN